MGFDFNQLILYFPAFVIAISVHEASHAFSATLLGDPSPRAAGRLSLNPLRHLDPLGTFTLIFAGFGWGKPVGVNPGAFKIDPKTGMALTAVAGPASNILTAVAVGLLYNLALEPSLGPLARWARFEPANTEAWFLTITTAIIYINVLLAVFNLIPLPPLDGFSVLMGLLPYPIAMRIAPIAKYGPGILLLLFFLPFVIHVNVIGSIISPPIDLLFRLIVGR